MMRKLFRLVLLFTALLLLGVGAHPVSRAWAANKVNRVVGGAGKSVEDRLAQFGNAADTRWRERFARAQAAYPPASATLVAVKDEKRLAVYAPGPDGRARFIHAFPILAASGGPGPKLREGDLQVPEGFYAVESLNPNSLYHVALRVSYPSLEDRERAKEDGRSNLGGDIMIHGKRASIGCLAMGDPAAEDLFTLAARSGRKNLRLVFCPTDFRKNPAFAPPAGAPAWTAARYARLREALASLPPAK